jgi:hypothetical protein
MSDPTVGDPSGSDHPVDEPTPDQVGREHEIVAAAATDPGEATELVPTPMARIVGLLSILAAGAAGGFIGYAVTDLQCTGECTVQTGVGGLVGAIIGAVGVGIVVQLALRAMNEWRVIEAKGGRAAELQRQKARERRQPPESRPRPRVR